MLERKNSITIPNIKKAKAAVYPEFIFEQSIVMKNANYCIADPNRKNNEKIIP